MLRTPSTVSVANQTTITGPNILPTRSVPRRWTANRPVRITSVSGMIQAWSRGVTTCMPSMADSTEMAGVMTPSP